MTNPRDFPFQFLPQFIVRRQCALCCEKTYMPFSLRNRLLRAAWKKSKTIFSKWGKLLEQQPVSNYSSNWNPVRYTLCGGAVQCEVWCVLSEVWILHCEGTCCTVYIIRIAKSGWCHCHWPQVKIATIDGLVSPLALLPPPPGLSSSASSIFQLTFVFRISPLLLCPLLPGSSSFASSISQVFWGLLFKPQLGHQPQQMVSLSLSHTCWSCSSAHIQLTQIETHFFR